VGSAYDRLPLNALRVFEAVATRLNFGDAAEALHVTPAAVSQQIKALEDYLQMPLFRRSGRKVELTPEGAQLLPGVRAGLDELETTLQRLKGARQSGSINLSVLPSFLQKWLTPRLGDLHARHPGVELRIQSSPDLVDFARSDFHAAVRLGAGRYPGLYVEKLMDDWLLAVAAPRVLKKHGPLDADAEPDARPLLHGVELDWSSWWAGGAASRKAQRGAYMDDSVSVLEAAIEGLGYALIRWTLAAGELAAGRIALASERVIPYRFSYYFVCPKTYVALPKVATFRDWLRAQAREFAPPPVPRRR
jgi:LysR family transcriptional regulator, glycine cleavage system transcriptional activator